MLKTINSLEKKIENGFRISAFQNFQEKIVKNKRIIFAIGGALLVAFPTYFYSHFAPKTSHTPPRYLPDDALLAIIKSDKEGFKKFLKDGGSLHSSLPMIEDKVYSVIEGVVHFERLSFVEELQKENIPFLRQDLTKEHDLVSIAIEKNNPELLKALLKEKPKLDRLYGRKGEGLLHLATLKCSTQMVQILHAQGLDWNTKNKEGSSALTFAAEKECLPLLTFWKSQGADFRKNDSRGQSALSILKNKKDLAIAAFTQSFFTERKMASVSAKEVSFYHKRKVPRESLAQRSNLIEPADRPLEAYETADHSEFAD